MGWFDDDSAAKKAKAERAKAPIKHSGSFLSWGGSGRAETKPGLFGLGGRVARDTEQENAKSGWFGQRGAKHVTSKAKRAQDQARGKKGLW